MYNKQQHLHFIGIGGVGMAGIAEVLFNLGYSVSGSDVKRGVLTDALETLGVAISIGHSAEHLPESTDVVVLSSAIESDNPERVEALRRGIPLIPRAEMLAELMRMKYGIAVAGSHGKTTTTSMTAKILRDVGFDPTVIVGGRILSERTGALLGHGEYLVAEADESDGSFCLLRPAIAIVTNIDAEHLSHYGSFAKLTEAFESFLNEVPFYGLAVVNGDDPILQEMSQRLSRRVRTYGFGPHCDVRAREVRFENNRSHFTLCIEDKEEIEVCLPIAGMHMVSNSLAAACVGLELGAFAEEVSRSLSGFAGVSRRCECVYDDGHALILDDYGHHPTEIRATLRAIRQGYLQSRKTEMNPNARLIVLFEPHRFSRTKELFADFLPAFDDADRLLITDIYPAGEAPIEGVSSEKLVQSMQHPDSRYCARLSSELSGIVEDLQKGDVVVTLGAGAISGTSKDLARLLQERSAQEST